MHQYGHTIYQTKHNLSGKDLIYIWNLSDQLSGRYCPETGRDWKKPAKNRLFLELFATFHTLSDTVFILNFKRRYTLMKYTLLVSFRKFGLNYVGQLYGKGAKNEQK